ncbi:hypothetical protein LCGC14_1924350, partial [marine sediment metagenome]
ILMNDKDVTGEAVGALAALEKFE